MSSTTGFNEAQASAAIDLIISTEADVRLMVTELDYGDTATELDTKEVSAADYGPVTVTETDWSVAFDATNNEATLTNDVEVDYGEAANDWGTVVDVAIHDPATDRFIIADEVNDPQITTGEKVRFPAGEITYTLGP